MIYRSAVYNWINPLCCQSHARRPFLSPPVQALEQLLLTTELSSESDAEASDLLV